MNQTINWTLLNVLNLDKVMYFKASSSIKNELQSPSDLSTCCRSAFPSDSRFPLLRYSSAYSKHHQYYKPYLKVVRMYPVRSDGLIKFRGVATFWSVSTPLWEGVFGGWDNEEVVPVMVLAVVRGRDSGRGFDSISPRFRSIPTRDGVRRIGGFLGSGLASILLPTSLERRVCEVEE